MKKLILALLCSSSLCQAQMNQGLTQRFPAHILYKIEEVNSKVKLTEDKKVKIGQKLFTADSLANISLTKGEAVERLKSYYTIDANFLQSILSAEEMDHYGYETDKNNRFLVALNFVKELKLESTQIDNIRQQKDSLASTPKMNSKETIRLYNKKLHTILDKEQYAKLLRIIYQDQSVEEAQEDWKKVLKLKLVTDEKDRTEYIKIINYHLAKNGYLDKKADRYDKTKRDLLAKKMALGEPSILIRANILSNGPYSNNKYASVIKYETELELTKSQIDTLLLKYKQLERIKLENKENEFTTNPSKVVPSEYENISHILNSEQVKKWLIHKNQKEAKKEALKNWEQLETQGLAKDLDKGKTLTEFATYQLKFLVTKDRAMIYHTQENIFMKRDVERKKPELLKQLDVINRSKSKNTTTKNALTW